jgi:hypothetical protein
MSARAEKIIARKPELTIDEINNYYLSIDKIRHLSRCHLKQINSEIDLKFILSQILLGYKDHMSQDN